MAFAGADNGDELMDEPDSSMSSGTGMAAPPKSAAPKKQTPAEKRAATLAAARQAKEAKAAETEKANKAAEEILCDQKASQNWLCLFRQCKLAKLPLGKCFGPSCNTVR